MCNGKCKCTPKPRKMWKVSLFLSIKNIQPCKLIEKGLRYHVYYAGNSLYREVYGRKAFNGPLVLLRLEWREL
jgi:hypothetical protein